MIKPSPTAASPVRDLQSHQASKVVAASVRATRAVSADAELRANRLNEMPRFHRKLKSRNGVSGVELAVN